MKVVAVGTACFVAGLAIGAGALVIVGDDEAAAPATHSGDDIGADDGEADRGGHILVFLVEGVPDSDRQGVEAALDADEGVEAHEYWNAEASRAEARRLFRDNPEMLEKIDAGVYIPESYRLVLRDPTRPNAMVVSSHLEGLPGVLEVVITNTVPELGD